MSKEPLKREITYSHAGVRIDIQIRPRYYVGNSNDPIVGEVIRTRQIFIPENNIDAFSLGLEKLVKEFKQP